jgi:hypothetical protein
MAASRLGQQTRLDHPCSRPEPLPGGFPPRPEQRATAPLTEQLHREQRFDGLAAGRHDLDPRQIVQPKMNPLHQTPIVTRGDNH